jgi:hypothetical protein
VPDLDKKQLVGLARKTAFELRMILATSKADDAGHLAWRLSMLARHVLSQLPADPRPRTAADTTPSTQ